MRYCLIPWSMKWFKFSMNILWPFIFILSLLGLLPIIQSETFVPLDFISQLLLILVALLNVILIRGIDSTSVWMNSIAVWVFALALIILTAVEFNVGVAIWPAMPLLPWAICDTIYMFKRKADIFDPSIRKLRKAYIAKYPEAESV